jgi:hypothetical protein
VIKHYRNLEEGLNAGAYPNWMPTYFSKIARDLSIIEDNNRLIQLTLQNKENNRLARKARKMANAKVVVYQMEQKEPEQMDQMQPVQVEPEQMEQIEPGRMEQTRPEQMDQVQPVQMKPEQMEQMEPEQLALEQMEQVVQVEQPQLLSKARIDNVMIAIALAMARNDHDVPIMVLSLDCDGEPSMTEFTCEGEDKNKVPVSERPVQPKGSGVRDFDHIFKDPPNVRELIARICHPPASEKGQC